MSGRGTERAYYDADVLVIGGGPAGLAAAIRARWVKGYRALVSSVVIFDPAPPGGLLRWGGCVLSGPSWSERGTEVLKRLEADIDRFDIPLIPHKVVSIKKQNHLFHIMLDNKTCWTGHTIVLSPGFRPMHIDPAWFQAGVWMTYKGNDFFPSILDNAAKGAKGRGLLIVGRRDTYDLIPLLRKIAGKAGGLRFLIEENPQHAIQWRSNPACKTMEALGPLFLGRLSGMEKGVEGDLKGAFITTLEHHRQFIECGAVFIDYRAFELNPLLDITGALPLRDERGFIKVDAWMRTDLPGLFAAGDITGRYASTLSALGDGVTAGFSAHRHAFQAKFGHEPHLFAYRATPGDLENLPGDLPSLPDEAVPIILNKKLKRSNEFLHALDDRLSLGELRALFNASMVESSISKLIENKDITIHLETK